MSTEFGNDATYLVRGFGHISFQMPLDVVLELDFVLIILVLKKNLLLVSCMTDVQWRVAFERKQCC